MNTHTTAPALSAANLRRVYGHGDQSVTAVADVSFTIAGGEIVALLGSNGAGKTTTLDMVLGFNTPTAGTVSVLGGSPREAIRSGRISGVLQTGGLLADLTVAETVSVIADLYGAKKRTADVMAKTGLDTIAKRRVSKCSGGEQQRVKFALALLPDPDILVLDEPTAGMDVNARRAFWDVMRDEADAGRTVVFATHYLAEAEQFARRTIVMHAGRIVADAPTSDLRASLGGRAIRADFDSHDAAARAADRFRSDPQVSDVLVDGITLHLQSPEADRITRAVLDAGGHGVEVSAPTLESAFTTLTTEGAS